MQCYQTVFDLVILDSSIGFFEIVDKDSQQTKSVIFVICVIITN